MPGRPRHRDPAVRHRRAQAQGVREGPTLSRQLLGQSKGRVALPTRNRTIRVMLPMKYMLRVVTLRRFLRVLPCQQREGCTHRPRHLAHHPKIGV
eukprot:1612629-Pyramimonas_sp.AAC.1